MAKNLSLEVIEKIVQILLSNQNKINLLRNDLSTISNNGNNIKLKTNQFINGLEIDIKNILSLLDRIKNDLKNNQNNINKTYCLNNDKNMFQDILICGSCDCCRCHKCCECSTNNCSENQQLIISNTNNNRNNISHEYIKESVNSIQDNNSDYRNIKTFNDNNLQKYVSPPSSSNNYITFPNLNLDNNFSNNDNNNNFNDNNNFNYNPLNPYNNKPNNLNMYNNQGRILNTQMNTFTPKNNINYNNNFLNENQKPFGYIKKQQFKQFNNLDIDDNNIPISEKIKNSAIMKSKRFHGSKSFDNFEGPPFSNRNKAKIIYNKNNNNNYNNYNDNINNINNSFKKPKNNNTINIEDYNNNNINYTNKKNKKNNNIFNNNLNNNKNNINNNLAQKKKKLEKINKIQKFLNKLYKQPKDINNRFKKIYGDDIEEKLLNGDIDNDNLIEMENILDKIIKMSIWGEEDKKNKKREYSSSYDKKLNKKKQHFVYNPVQEKIKLMKSVKDKQAYFREFPRGWNSTKEYFINNGTEINNENLNKYL